MGGIQVDSAAFKEITANGLWPAPRLVGGVEGPDRRPPSEAEVEMCARWLHLFGSRARGLDRKRSSYSLKHDVEAWTARMGVTHRQQHSHGLGEFMSERFYVSNGAFIEAARRLGYRIKPTSEGSPNAYFNIRVDHATAAERITGELVEYFRRGYHSMSSEEQREEAALLIGEFDAVAASTSGRGRRPR